MAHDFVKFPELTNGQMDIYYFESPHKQIFESFTAQCVRVHDGDTIAVRWNQRDFDFPIRFISSAAPEVGGKKGKEVGGDEAQQFLERRILGQIVDIIVDPDNRVERWGRLLGKVYHGGVDVAEEMINLGIVQSWNNRNDGLILDTIVRGEF